MGGRVGQGARQTNYPRIGKLVRARPEARQFDQRSDTAISASAFGTLTSGGGGSQPPRIARRIAAAPLHLNCFYSDERDKLRCNGCSGRRAHSRGRSNTAEPLAAAAVRNHAALPRGPTMVQRVLAYSDRGADADRRDRDWAGAAPNSGGAGIYRALPRHRHFSARRLFRIPGVVAMAALF